MNFHTEFKLSTSIFQCCDMEPPTTGISKLRLSPTKSEIDQQYDILTVLLLLYWMSKYFNLCS